MEDLRQRYEQDGFVVLPGLLSEHSQIRAELDQMMADHDTDQNTDWNSSGGCTVL